MTTQAQKKRGAAHEEKARLTKSTTKNVNDIYATANSNRKRSIKKPRLNPKTQNRLYKLFSLAAIYPSDILSLLSKILRIFLNRQLGRRTPPYMEQPLDGLELAGP